MRSQGQGWDAEGQRTRALEQHGTGIRSAYCALLQPLRRKETHLDYWGRAEAGAGGIRNSAMGGEKEGAEDRAVSRAATTLGKSPSGDPSPCLT